MKIKKDIDKNIFREYDIRGNAILQIDEDAAYSIGLAYATKARSLGKTVCVVGHDNRTTGEKLTNALIKGITEAGMDVKYIGLVTTPMYYFACIYLKIDTGIMVTASHNPVEDNGFKIALSNYDNACGDKIRELYDIITNGEFTSGEGTVEEVDIRNAYLDRIHEDIKIDRKLKVIVDPANATTSIIVHDVFDKYDLDITYINDASDGTFPNHHPDPSVPANMKELQEKVIELGADVGIAYDGDGDRVGIVDEKGNIVAADTLMAIFWDDLMPKSKNKTALYDVKCSKQLEDEIIRLGGTPYVYRTGNSYQKNKIKEMDLTFGGELSGHIFFRDRWDGFDDGIYASLRLLELMSKTDKTLSELYSHMTKYYNTPSFNVPVKEEEKSNIVEFVKKYSISKGYKINDIDGIRVEFDDSWGLIRASNTGPNLTLRFEASTEDRLEELKNEFVNLIQEKINNK